MTTMRRPLVNRRLLLRLPATRHKTRRISLSPDASMPVIMLLVIFKLCLPSHTTYPKLLINLFKFQPNNIWARYFLSDWHKMFSFLLVSVLYCISLLFIINNEFSFVLSCISCFYHFDRMDLCFIFGDSVV